MKFKAGVEKLETGWHVYVVLPTIEKAQEVFDSMANENGDENAPRFEACIKELSTGDYRLKIYKSKLSQAQAFVKEMFLSLRDEVETSENGSEENSEVFQDA